MMKSVALLHNLYLSKNTDKKLFLHRLREVICDVIKQNQSEVGNIDFKIEPNKA